MIRIFTFFVAVLAAVLPLTAQDAVKPITWQVTVRQTGSGEGVAVFKARLSSGWHLYSMTMPKSGPKPTIIDLSGSRGVKFVSEVKADREPMQVHDDMFDMDLGWWDSDIAFRCKFKVTDPTVAKIAGKIVFMGCNNQTCLPPATVTFDKKVK